MLKQYRIIEVARTANFRDFKEAILVKVVSDDEFNYWNEIKDDPYSEEEVMNMEQWLMFKYSPSKLKEISNIQDECYEGGVWYLDLEKDFILHSISITNHETGEGFIRPIYQVVMVTDNMDILEAKKQNKAYKGRNGSQQKLDELGLPLEGKEEFKYYIIGQGKNGEYYGIPYDYTDDYDGHFKVDEISINPWNGEISIVKPKVGIYNPMIGQFFKFA